MHRRLYAAFMLLISAWPMGASHGDEPDLDAWLEKLPLLSSENKQLKSFYFRGKCRFGEHVTARFDVGWTKSGESASLISVGGDDSVPAMYCSHGQMFLVDYLRGVVTLHEKCKPNFNSGVNDANHILFNMGFSSKESSEIAVDLASFLRGNCNSGQWKPGPPGTWQYTNTSKSGLSSVVAHFDLEHSFPLRKLQVSGEDAAAPLLIFEDLTINEPLPKCLRLFPARDNFPDGIVVESKTFAKDNKLAAVADIMKQLMSSLLATTAIDRPELREAVELFPGVDWKQAKANRDKFAPQIRKLLNDQP